MCIRDRVDSADVIGGINAMTGESEGLELIDAVFPTFGVVPGSILAPRFGEDPAVAAIMAAKDVYKRQGGRPCR